MKTMQSAGYKYNCYMTSRALTIHNTLALHDGHVMHMMDTWLIVHRVHYS